MKVYPDVFMFTRLGDGKGLFRKECQHILKDQTFY